MDYSYDTCHKQKLLSWYWLTPDEVNKKTNSPGHEISPQRWNWSITTWACFGSNLFGSWHLDGKYVGLQSSSFCTPPKSRFFGHITFVRCSTFAKHLKRIRRIIKKGKMIECHQLLQNHAISVDWWYCAFRTIDWIA